MALRPRRQGEHDGACGFYAAGNALLWLWPELDADLIFVTLFSWILRRGKTDHFIQGVKRDTLLRALRATAKALAPEGSSLRVRAPFWSSSAASLGVFKEMVTAHFLARESCAAIIGYDYHRTDAKRDHYAHWTVVGKVTGRSMQTFDSKTERKFIPFSMCRVSGAAIKHRARPYCLETTSTFLLWREEEA